VGIALPTIVSSTDLYIRLMLSRFALVARYKKKKRNTSCGRQAMYRSEEGVDME
jgi:hypothetical protein